MWARKVCAVKGVYVSKLADILRGPPASSGSSLSEKLRLSSAPRRNWSPGAPVANSPELERILALPRRDIETPDPSRFQEYRRYECKLPGCPFAIGLRDNQAVALSEFQQNRGALCLMPVGSGKTLVSLLAPTLVDSKVAVLLISSRLKDQLLTRDLPHIAKHWRIPNLAGGPTFYTDTKGLLHVVAYSTLSTVRGADLLDRIEPDLVVADECHRVKAVSSARTKRFRRYFKTHPSSKLLALSGTITNRSVKDYSHLAQLALGAGSPLPRDYPTLTHWALALDPSPFPCDPGALERLCQPGEAVRSGFRRRLTSTPGIVPPPSKRDIGTSLVISRRDLVVPNSIQTALAHFRENWELPDGEIRVEDALTFYAHARELACGMYLHWVWPRLEPVPVQDAWKEARKGWFREVRDYLTSSPKPGMDSQLFLYMAAQDGRWPSLTWPRWHELKKTAKPESEAVWVDDFLVRDAVEWGRESPGLIWVEHPALGEAIAKAGGWTYYGEGFDGKALLLEDGSKTLVCSMRTLDEGVELQPYNRNLLTSVPNALLFEQIVGRSHRYGQLADEVTVDLYLHTRELEKALSNARRDGEYRQQTLGTQEKICYANYTFVCP